MAKNAQLLNELLEVSAQANIPSVSGIVNASPWPRQWQERNPALLHGDEL
jgi:hypothetical protein